MQLKRARLGKGLKPWIRSWRGGSNKWRNLPAITRGLARELETWADDDGRIELDHAEDPKAALWRLVAAHPHERQTLGKHLDRLIENGTIELSAGLAVFPNWSVYQDTGHADDVSAAQALDKRDASAAQARRKCGASEVEAKPAEPLKVDLGDTDTDTDTDTEVVEQRPQEPPSERVRTAFFKCWKAIRNDPEISRGRDNSGPVADALLAASEADGVPFDALLAGVMERYWREDWPRNRRNTPTFGNLLGGLPRYVADTVEAYRANERRRKRAAEPQATRERFWDGHAQRWAWRDLATGEVVAA